MSWPALYGLNESLRWLEEDVGHEWIFERGQAMTQKCRTMLAELPGVALLSPITAAGLTAFTVEGAAPQAASYALYDMGVVVRSLHNPECLRVSTAFFNDEADLARLREGLLALGALTKGRRVE